MKKSARKSIALTVGTIVIMLAAGCEEQNLSNVKKHRLIATENIQLKKQLQQRDAEIEKQKPLCDKKIERQKKLLEKCRLVKMVLEERVNENIQERVDAVLTAVMEKNANLQKENNQLKAEIGQLKKEIEDLKRELEMHKGPTPLESGAN